MFKFLSYFPLRLSWIVSLLPTQYPSFRTEILFYKMFSYYCDHISLHINIKLTFLELLWTLRHFLNLTKKLSFSSVKNKLEFLEFVFQS